MPLSGHDPARDADDATEPAAPRPAVPRGRFGVAEFPLDPNLVAGADRALPTRTRLEPDESPPGGRRPPPIVWLAVAVVMALIVGAGAVMVLASGGAEREAGPVPPRPTVPTSTIDFDVTIPTVPPQTTSTTTTEPWVPEVPDEDLIVYDSPGLIEPGQDIIEFRDASTLETLTLANNGGGAANWVLSVQAGSGLDVSPAEGQLKPGESVEVRILLDRENGRPLTDWAEDITMIGGGNTRPTSVRVKIFAL